VFILDGFIPYVQKSFSPYMDIIFFAFVAAIAGFAIWFYVRQSRKNIEK
jgi:hypothetical protein